jgi:hypothetical protein
LSHLCGGRSFFGIVVSNALLFGADPATTTFSCESEDGSSTRTRQPAALSWSITN